nr:MAG TPA: hypothetical protein [Caudoviricetes sp.]
MACQSGVNCPSVISPNRVSRASLVRSASSTGLPPMVAVSIICGSAVAAVPNMSRVPAVAPLVTVLAARVWAHLLTPMARRVMTSVLASACFLNSSMRLAVRLAALLAPASVTCSAVSSRASWSPSMAMRSASSWSRMMSTCLVLRVTLSMVFLRSVKSPVLVFLCEEFEGFPRRRREQSPTREELSGDLHVLRPAGRLNGEVDLGAQHRVGGDGVLGAHADANGVDVDHVAADEGAVGVLAVSADNEAFGALLEGFHGEILVGMLGVGVVDDLDARTGDFLPAGVFVIHGRVFALVADRVLRRRAGPAAKGDVVGQVGASADFGRGGLVDVVDGRHPDRVYLAVRRCGRDLDSQVEGHFRSLKRNPPRPMAFGGLWCCLLVTCATS